MWLLERGAFTKILKHNTDFAELLDIERLNGVLSATRFDVSYKNVSHLMLPFFRRALSSVG